MTLKQFYETVDELKTIYPFEDDKTRLTIYDLCSRTNNMVRLTTTDAKTGATVVVEKRPRIDFSKFERACENPIVL